eukprot:m.3811 g.3811  ORF g.3811 m.3811 type:complete len:1247 (+) comp4312_c0_seq2:389-4129(+)
MLHQQAKPSGGKAGRPQVMARVKALKSSLRVKSGDAEGYAALSQQGSSVSSDSMEDSLQALGKAPPSASTSGFPSRTGVSGSVDTSVHHFKRRTVTRTTSTDSKSRGYSTSFETMQKAARRASMVSEGESARSTEDDEPTQAASSSTAQSTAMPKSLEALSSSRHSDIAAATLSSRHSSTASTSASATLPASMSNHGKQASGTNIRVPDYALCAACDAAMFSISKQPMHLKPCSHTVCAECSMSCIATTPSTLTSNACPVCNLEVTSVVPDVALYTCIIADVRSSSRSSETDESLIKKGMRASMSIDSHPDTGSSSGKASKRGSSQADSMLGSASLTSRRVSKQDISGSSARGSVDMIASRNSIDLSTARVVEEDRMSPQRSGNSASSGTPYSGDQSQQLGLRTTASARQEQWIKGELYRLKHAEAQLDKLNTKVLTVCEARADLEQKQRDKEKQISGIRTEIEKTDKLIEQLTAQRKSLTDTLMTEEAGVLELQSTMQKTSTNLVQLQLKLKSISQQVSSLRSQLGDHAPPLPTLLQPRAATPTPTNTGTGREYDVDSHVVCGRSSFSEPLSDDKRGHAATDTDLTSAETALSGQAAVQLPTVSKDAFEQHQRQWFPSEVLSADAVARRSIKGSSGSRPTSTDATTSDATDVEDSLDLSQPIVFKKLQNTRKSFEHPQTESSTICTTLSETAGVHLALSSVALDESAISAAANSDQSADTSSPRAASRIVSAASSFRSHTEPASRRLTVEEMEQGGFEIVVSDGEDDSECPCDSEYDTDDYGSYATTPNTSRTASCSKTLPTSFSPIQSNVAQQPTTDLTSKQALSPLSSSQVQHSTPLSTFHKEAARLSPVVRRDSESTRSTASTITPESVGQGTASEAEEMLAANLPSARVKTTRKSVRSQTQRARSARSTLKSSPLTSAALSKLQKQPPVSPLAMTASSMASAPKHNAELHGDGHSLWIGECNTVVLPESSSRAELESSDAADLDGEGASSSASDSSMDDYEVFCVPNDTSAWSFHDKVPPTPSPTVSPMPTSPLVLRSRSTQPDESSTDPDHPETPCTLSQVTAASSQTASAQTQLVADSGTCLSPSRGGITCVSSSVVTPSPNATGRTVPTNYEVLSSSHFQSSSSCSTQLQDEAELEASPRPARASFALISQAEHRAVPPPPPLASPRSQRKGKSAPNSSVDCGAKVTTCTTSGKGSESSEQDCGDDDVLAALSMFSQQPDIEELKQPACAFVEEESEA